MKAILLITMLCVYVLSAQFPIHYTDDKGYSTIIAEKPERIVVAGGMCPLPPVILMLEGSAKSLVYMPKATKSAIKYAFVSEVFPNIDSIKVGDSENIEELLSLNPDLFICHNANIKLCEAMKKVPSLPLK